MTDLLIEFFHLPEIEDDTIWENNKNEINKKRKSKCQLKHQIIISE